MNFAYKIKERDNFRCRICNKQSCNLQIHHIKTVSDMMEEYNVRIFEEIFLYPEFFDEKNCIAICKNCHQTLHKSDAFVPTHMFTNVKISRDILLEIGGTREEQVDIVNDMLTELLLKENQLEKIKKLFRNFFQSFFKVFSKFFWRLQNDLS